MNGDFLFFIFFLVIFITGMIFRGYYGRRSPDFKKSGRELLQQAFQHESRLGVALQYLLGISIMMGMIIYLFFTPLYPSLQLPLPDLVQWIGVVIGLVSLPFIGWIHWTLGKNFSKSLTIQDNHQLVTTGPYKLVRHPMYTVFIFWFLSWFLVTANLSHLITWVISVVYFVIRIPEEEQMMHEEFGDIYQEYVKRTNRLFPRLRKKQKDS